MQTLLIFLKLKTGFSNLLDFSPPMTTTRISPEFIADNIDQMFAQMLNSVIQMKANRCSKQEFLSVIHSYITELRNRLPWLHYHPCHRLLRHIYKNNDSSSEIFFIDVGKIRRYIREYTNVNIQT